MFIDQSSAVCQYQLGFLVTSDKKKKAHVSEQLKGSSTQDVSASLCRFCGLASSARPLISGICGPKACLPVAPRITSFFIQITQGRTSTHSSISSNLPRFISRVVLGPGTSPEQVRSAAHSWTPEGARLVTGHSWHGISQLS